MVVGPATIVADRPPGADVALFDRIRVDVANLVRQDLTLETRFDKPVIREEIVKPKRFGDKIPAGSDNMRALRQTALNLPD